MLILNPDEYNKTVIDYALQFKNYEFLKYLMDKKYVWFVDDSKYDGCGRAFGFGAGTSIKRREIGLRDTLNIELQCYSEKRGLRPKMIVLAMENNDFKMLTSLCAREIPTLYQACTYLRPDTKCKDYYDENVIEEIAKSSDEIFGYFSEDFTIKSELGYENRFIYPYMNELIKFLLKNENKYAEVALRRAIEHNKCIFKKLSEIIDESFEQLKSYFSYGNNYKAPVEDVINATMQLYDFYDDDGILFYMSRGTKKCHLGFCANVVRVEAESNNNSLIEELNISYNAVRNIQPDTSKY